jgi:hypothetical protein
MSKIHLETSYGVVLQSYEDLKRHHESSGREPGRSYATAPNGELEEVRRVPRDNGQEALLFKKDLALVRDDTNSDRNVPVPSPIKPAGYISYENDGTNTAIIYDRPYDPSKPEPNRLAYIMHMDREPRLIPEGGRVEYGQPIGIQSDVGSRGQIHVHIEAEYSVLRGYVDDFINGRLTTKGAVQDAPQPTPSPPTSTEPPQASPLNQLNQLDPRAGKLYQEINKLFEEKLPAGTFKSEQERTNSVLALTAQAYDKGLNGVADVGLKNGVLAVSETKIDSPTAVVPFMKLEDAVKQTPEQSVGQIAQKHNELQAEPKLKPPAESLDTPQRHQSM